MLCVRGGGSSDSVSSNCSCWNCYIEDEKCFSWWRGTYKSNIHLCKFTIDLSYLLMHLDISGCSLVLEWLRCLSLTVVALTHFRLGAMLIIITISLYMIVITIEITSTVRTILNFDWATYSDLTVVLEDSCLLVEQWMLNSYLSWYLDHLRFIAMAAKMRMNNLDWLIIDQADSFSVYCHLRDPYPESDLYQLDTSIALNPPRIMQPPHLWW